MDKEEEYLYLSGLEKRIKNLEEKVAYNLQEMQNSLNKLYFIVGEIDGRLYNQENAGGKE